jgi:hypothetical protein
MIPTEAWECFRSETAFARRRIQKPRAKPAMLAVMPPIWRGKKKLAMRPIAAVTNGSGIEDDGDPLDMATPFELRLTEQF